jgi:NhaP-type Na+/H+ or K+/H+ antiporter
MSAWTGVAVGTAVIGYALVSRPLGRSVVSAPMVFLGVGLGLGPLGFDLFSLATSPEPIRILLELTLVLVLFTDAVTVRSGALRRVEFLPVRLLGIGLPLTIGLGWLVAWPLLPGLTVWELALVGVILAPTDAALGQAAIADPGVPSLVRQGLNVESGLNDGMSLPFFLIFLAAVAEPHGTGPGPLEVFLRALVLSTVLGGGVGWVVGRALGAARASGWIGDRWRQILVVATALTGYYLAVAVEGSGFIAAWVAGLAFGITQRGTAGAEGVGDPAGASRRERDLSRSTDFAEDLGRVLTMLSFLVFGAVLLGPVLEHLTWRPVVYALLSLTVIRTVPVVLSLRGSGLCRPTEAYIAWFGPRGLASIVLGLIVLAEGVPGVGLVTQTVAVTVGMSIVAHGATAVPLASGYARWYERAAGTRPGLREASAKAATPADR